MLQQFDIFLIMSFALPNCLPGAKVRGQVQTGGSKERDLGTECLGVKLRIDFSKPLLNQNLD